MRVSDRIKISENVCQIANIARRRKKTFRALAKKRGDQSQKERKIAALAEIFFVFNKEIHYYREWGAFLGFWEQYWLCELNDS